MTFARRGDRLEDFVGGLRACWGPGPVHYEGRFYQIIESDIGPKPLQPGGPPLLFGAVTPAALRRAARLADGLNHIAHDWRLLEWMLPTYFALVREARRDPAKMIVVVRTNHPVSLTGPLPEPRPPLGGSVEQIREDVGAWLLWACSIFSLIWSRSPSSSNWRCFRACAAWPAETQPAPLLHALIGTAKRSCVNGNCQPESVSHHDALSQRWTCWYFVTFVMMVIDSCT